MRTGNTLIRLGGWGGGGALQFSCSINDVLETKCGQIYKQFSVLKPFWV